MSSWSTSEKNDESINLALWLFSSKCKENQNWGIDFKKPSDFAIIYPHSKKTFANNYNGSNISFFGRFSKTNSKSKFSGRFCIKNDLAFFSSILS